MATCLGASVRKRPQSVFVAGRRWWESELPEREVGGECGIATGGMKGERMVHVWVAVVLTLGCASGQRQINVISPHFFQQRQVDEFDGLTKSRATMFIDGGICAKCRLKNSYLLVDRRRSTVFTTPSKTKLEASGNAEFQLSYSLSYKVKVIRYKIHVGDNTKESWYPRSWQILLSNPSERTVTVHEVKNAEFKNGVFVGKFENRRKYRNIHLRVTEDSTPGDDEMKIKIAEFEAFGPRGQYDSRVLGGFPCTKAPRYMLQAGPKKFGTPFTNDPNVSKDDLNLLFDDKGGVSVGLDIPGPGPLVLGYHFTKAKQVVQFGLGFFLNPAIGERRVILEANPCDPSCDYLGEDGWIVVAARTGAKHQLSKWLVHEPGFYRAYRVKVDRFFENRAWPLRELSFLQC